MIDVWSSAGVRPPRPLAPADNVPYHIEEISFPRLRRDGFNPPNPMSVQESLASLLTQMVKLNAILYEIHTAIQVAAAAEAYEFHQHDAVGILTRKLDDWSRITVETCPWSMQEIGVCPYCSMSTVLCFGADPLHRHLCIDDVTRDSR